MSLPTDINDHVAEALARLPEQYKNKPNIAGFITAICNVVQKIENALIQLRENRIALDGSVVGVQLDLLGGIVVQPRVPGQSDADYLKAIIAKIGLNTSKGQGESVIQAFLIGSACTKAVLYEFFPAHVQILGNLTLTQDEVNAVSAAVEASLPAGVHLDSVGYFPPLPFALAGSALPSAGLDDGTGLVGGSLSTGYIRNDV